MKHIIPLNSPNLKSYLKFGGCQRCSASCQSACKTSCTVANQKCENLSRTESLEDAKKDSH